MKKILTLVISGILLLSCNQKNKAKNESANLGTESQEFEWLLGNWKRNHEEKGKETFENWKKINETEYSGIGFTMQNGDTIKQEKMRIVKSDGKWILIVKAPEDDQSVKFSMTDIKEGNFVCTNDSIEFPKRIEYTKNGEKINALVSGGELKIPFEFERIK